METVCLIHSKGDPKWIQSVPIWERSPWVEAFSGYNLLKDKEGPRFITSHLFVQLFPRSFFKSKAKVSACSQDSLDQYSLNFNLPMAPHSSTLAWKIPWTEEPGGLQSMGS